jgi:hypothetical protein
MKETIAPVRGYRIGQKKVPGAVPCARYSCRAREYLRYSKESWPYKPLKPATRLNERSTNGIKNQIMIFENRKLFELVFIR